MKRSVSWLLILSSLSCGGPKSGPTTPAAVGEPGGASGVPVNPPPEGDGKGGLPFTLKELAGTAPADARVRTLEGTALNAKESAALWRGVPALPAEKGDVVSFAKREGSAPPPTATVVAEQPFPPASTQNASAGPVEKRPLEVVRFAPEGEVPIARELSVTFNQPMVPLTSHSQSVAGTLPVTLAPAPAGAFRWIGTSTLLFTAEPRFPASSEFTVTIPAGTKSLAGSALAKAQSFRFRTPLVALDDVWPSEDQTTALTPNLFLRFNQKVKPEALVSALSLEAKGKKFALRLATPDEIAADEIVKARVEQLVGEGLREQGVVVRPVEALPYAAKVTLTLPAGATVGEGPRPTKEAIARSFSTHGPFALKAVTCTAPCPPMGGVQLQLTNAVDAQAFDPSLVRIEPAVPMQVFPGGDQVYLQAETEPRTKYTVTVGGALRDMFGQTLGKDASGTFETGDALPSVTGLPPLVVLDPRAETRALNIESMNLESLTIEVRKVEPKDYLAFAKAREQLGQNGAPKLPGSVVATQKVALKDKRNVRVTTAVDVSKALSGAFGHAIVSIEPKPSRTPEVWLERSLAWVQSTEIGLDAVWDRGELAAWTTALADGGPLAGVEVKLEPDGSAGQSDADGVARLKLPPGQANQVRLLVARRGSDVALLPEHPWGAHAGGMWTAQRPDEWVRAFVFDDRGLYRPGEAVHLKGWLRAAQGQGAPRALKGADAVSYEVTSQGGEVFARGKARLNDLGGFDASFALPKTVHLGQSNVHFTLPGRPNGEFYHGFQIEEYRRPEYEVHVAASEPVHFAGDRVKVAATASYHAGGALAEAKTTWSVTARSTRFTPPGRDGFTFGDEPVFWERMAFWPHRDPGKTETLTGRTDGHGVHTLEVATGQATPAFVHELEVNASVEDLSRQNFADKTTLLVHPAEVYVGLRTTRSFSTLGEAVTAEALVTDLDGKAIAERPVTIALIELESKFEKGEYKTNEREVEHCKVASGGDVVRCELHPKNAGSYRVVARVTDAKGRPSDTRIRHWVSGESDGPLVSGRQGQVELVPDRKSYAPGDVAKVLVRAPFSPADALVRVVHEQIVELKRVALPNGSASVEVKIGADHVPNLNVLVEVVGRGKAEGGDVQLPVHASGQLDLPVSLDARRLAVSVEPAETKLEPGAKTRIKVSVRDAKGNAQKGADVALIVVDEAILQMLEREAQDPVEVMHPHVDGGGGAMSARDFVVVSRKAQMAQGGVVAEGAAVASGGRGKRSAERMAAAPMASLAMADSAQAGGGGGATPLRMRTLFDPLALFAASLRTDGQGTAQADVTLPDTLTRYRVLAFAAADEVLFGRGESAITARKLLMVRPAMARFINLGDELSVPVLLQNESDEPLTVDVGVRAANFALTGATAKRVTVPAKDRIEVRFAGKSAKPGTVRLSFVARAQKLADGTELSLPAFTPATDEAFATYGDIATDGALAQPLQLPKDVSTAWGGLDVSLSSTEVAALTDAMLSVVTCPYDFPEQSASRILAVLATRDVLAAFAAEDVPSKEALDAMIATELARLTSLQRADGGFGYYDTWGEADPFVSVHVSHALARAQRAKIAVPADLASRLRGFVQNLPSLAFQRYGEEQRATVLAYGAYTEQLWGTLNSTLTKQALSAMPVQKAPAEALGWLLPVLKAEQQGQRVAELVRILQNRMHETAGKAEISSAGRDGTFVTFSSTKRETAVVLEALLATGEQRDLAPKLARGLLAGKKRGRWEGTQENVFSLLALRAYFDAYEKDVPHFTARAFLGNTLAADQRFEGRSTTQAFTHVPMAYLTQHPSDKLTLDKRGAGRLYYRLAMSYAPSSFVLSPADHGFVVERRYEAVDSPEDVRRDVEGSYRIRAGARVKVTVTMVAPSTRHHVALVDPLPAGLEAINPALAVSERLPDEEKWGRGPIVPFARMAWFGPWFEHQNLRDERAEAHASEVGAGVYTYTYYARATTPGHYIAPPAKAEELYAPETFGRGASDRVTIE